MPRKHHLIHTSLSTDRPPAPPHWHELLAAADELRADHSPEATELLRRLAAHDRSIELHPNSEHPHITNAAGMLRAKAISELADRDGPAHLELIAQAAFGTHHDTHVKDLATHCFRRVAAQLVRTPTNP
ncbi:MAG: hypothetical protein ACKVZJ_14060 [Phycisphaerales bacterium]